MGYADNAEDAAEQVAEMRAELTRREVCGSCEHGGRYFCLIQEEHEAPWNGTVKRGQQCRFTPSRWELVES